VRTVPGAYPRFYALVADALATGGPMPVGIEDAIASLRVIDAARRSSAEGVVVRI
jgi:predicted dehydrogenase